MHVYYTAQYITGRIRFIFFSLICVCACVCLTRKHWGFNFVRIVLAIRLCHPMDGKNDEFVNCQEVGQYPLFFLSLLNRLSRPMWL